MKKTLLSIFLLFSVFIVPATAYDVPGDTVVYITTYGVKYHKGNCYHLRSSKHETTIANAVAAGYTPCSACHPGTYGSSEPIEEASEEPQETYPESYEEYSDEQLKDAGFSYDSEFDMWIGDDGIIQDGVFYAYQELDGGEPEAEFFGYEAFGISYDEDSDTYMTEDGTVYEYLSDALESVGFYKTEDEDGNPIWCDDYGVFDMDSFTYIPFVEETEPAETSNDESTIELPKEETEETSYLWGLLAFAPFIFTMTVAEISDRIKRKKLKEERTNKK